jgi:hypothetical protein
VVTGYWQVRNGRKKKSNVKSSEGISEMALQSTAFEERKGKKMEAVM